MAKWFKRLGFTSLVLLVAYALTVQVLRWFAFGDEEREALAVMEQPLPVPPGPGGFKYLAFSNLDIPLAQLDAALAEDVAAYGAWQAGQAERLGRRWGYPSRPAICGMPTAWRACAAMKPVFVNGSSARQIASAWRAWPSVRIIWPAPMQWAWIRRSPPISCSASR